VSTKRDASQSASEGLTTTTPASSTATRAAPAGPSQGMSDTASAALAPFTARTVGSWLWSDARTTTCTLVSFLKPFGNKGRSTRSTTRMASTSRSLGGPSRLVKVAGILPYAEARSR
jgi:hypothetical protein